MLCGNIVIKYKSKRIYFN